MQTSAKNSPKSNANCNEIFRSPSLNIHEILKCQIQVHPRIQCIFNFIHEM
jgi:hypothetical protein